MHRHCGWFVESSTNYFFGETDMPELMLLHKSNQELCKRGILLHVFVKIVGIQPASGLARHTSIMYYMYIPALTCVTMHRQVVCLRLYVCLTNNQTTIEQKYIVIILPLKTSILTNGCQHNINEKLKSNSIHRSFYYKSIHTHFWRRRR